MNFKIFITGAALFAAGSTVKAQHTTNWTAAEKQPLDTTIKTGKLANGFTYFIRKNSEPKSRATFYLVVKAGAVLENDDQRGLAHFIEHMSFDGTTHFPKKELIEYLQKSGVRFGADLNAYTGFDETVYQLPLPTDDPKLLAGGLQIMRDWAGEATMDLEEIDKERGVVLEEKRLHKGVNSRLQDKLIPFQFNDSRYAARIPIGSERVLTTFKRPTLVSFYKDWYRPNLEGIIVVGDVNVPEIEKRIKAMFSDLKNPVNPRPRPDYTAALLNKNRVLVLTDPELSQINMSLEFKQVFYKEDGSKAAYRNTILHSLCSSLLQSRLAELGRASNAPVLSVSGSYTPVIHGINALTVSFTAKKNELEQGFIYVYDALRQIKEYGFTDGEIIRVKKTFQKRLQQMVNEKDHQDSGGLADELKRHFLTGEGIPGITYENVMINDLLPQLTPEIINTAIRGMIANNNRDVTLLGPASEKDSLPDETTINKWFNEQTPVKPYVEQKINDQLLGAKPKVGAIIKEEKDTALGFTTWILSNGAKVILKPTIFANDEVFFNAFSPGGSSLYSDKDYYTAANTVSIISGAGVGSHDKNEFSKLMEDKQAQVQPYISERFEGMQGISTKKDLETAMQLFYLRFTAPRKDTAHFTQLINRYAQIIAGSSKNPQTIFGDTVAAVLSNNNIRRTGATQEKLNSVKLGRAFQIYKERFANAGDFTFVFTGSFTPAEIKPLIEQYVASIPGDGSQHEKAKDLNIRIPRGRTTKTVYAGKEDKASVTLLFSGSFKYTNEEQVKMIALKDVIQFHMLERLREKEGGVYAPSASLGREHENGDFYRYAISFGCAPANVEKLIGAALQEVENIRKNGPSAEDMQKFYSEEGRQLELNKKSNDYWNNYLVNKLKNNEDINSLLTQDERIKAVTPQDVKAAANAYVSGDNLIRFILMPEKH